MEKFITEFPLQLRHAVEISKDIKLEKITQNAISNIIICGLGGSGIGGTIVKNFVFDKSPYPVEVIKNYELPRYADHKSLIILCSYSGNTEETLNCLDQAQRVTEHIIIVSSGGRMIDFAHEQGLTHFQLPDNFQPRAAMGYSLVMLLKVMQQLGVTHSDIEQDIIAASEFIESQVDTIKLIAENLAQHIIHKTPILYVEAPYEGVAVRWRQQINENAKTLCYHHVIPEMNHNELVALKNTDENNFVILLKTDDEFVRNELRFDFLEKKLQDYGIQYAQIEASGYQYWEKVFYLILIGDWLSFYLAELQEIDPNEVKIIDELKSFLSNNL